MTQFLGLCVSCGCKIYSDGPLEFDGVFCEHRLPNEPTGEEIRHEGLDQE